MSIKYFFHVLDIGVNIVFYIESKGKIANSSYT